MPHARVSKGCQEGAYAVPSHVTGSKHACRARSGSLGWQHGLHTLRYLSASDQPISNNSANIMHIPVFSPLTISLNSPGHAVCKAVLPASIPP